MKTRLALIAASLVVGFAPVWGTRYAAYFMGDTIGFIIRNPLGAAENALYAWPVIVISVVISTALSIGCCVALHNISNDAKAKA